MPKLGVVCTFVNEQKKKKDPWQSEAAGCYSMYKHLAGAGSFGYGGVLRADCK